MAQDFTTTALLASIKRRAMVPSNQATFSDADLLSLATEELQGRVAASMMAAREEFFVVETDLALVSGTVSYAIPTRAVGGKVRSVSYADTTVTPARVSTLARVDPTMRSDSSMAPGSFYVQGNAMVLTADPGTTTHKLRVAYFIRPSSLVATSAVAVISAINTGTRVVTLSATIPATFTTSQTFDFIGSKPGFTPLGIDYAASAASGTSMTFTTTLPTGLAVGDYVCLAGESPVPQIPPELHSLLAQRTAIRCMEAMGDREGMQAGLVTLQEMEKSARIQIEPRSDGNTQKVVKRYGFLGRTGRWRS